MAAKSRSKVTKKSKPATRRPHGRTRKVLAKTSASAKGIALAGTTAGGIALTAAHVASLPLFLAFGAAGAAFAVGTVLALDAFRPAAKVFGERFATRIDATLQGGALTKLLAEKVEANPRPALEGMRRLLEAIADEAAVPLADLTAEYVRDGKPVDGFFRGVSRLLAEMTSAEIVALREIAGLAIAADLTTVPAEGPEPGARVTLMYNRLFSGPPEPYQLQYVVRNEPVATPGVAGAQPQTRWEPLGPLKSADVALRAFQLLKLNALADERHSGGFYGVSGTRVAMIDADILRRLAALLQGA